MTLTRLLIGSFKAVIAAVFFGNAVLGLGGAFADVPPSQRLVAAGFGVAMLSIAAACASLALVDFRPGIDLAALKAGGTVVIRRSRRFAIGCAGIVPGIVAFGAATRLVPGMPPAAPYFFYFFAVICAGLAVYLWRQASAPVTLSPRGLLDPDYGPEPMPWSAMASVESAYWRGLPTTDIVITPRAGSEEPLRISAADLTVTRRDLLAAIAVMRGGAAERLSSVPSPHRGEG